VFQKFRFIGSTAAIYILTIGVLAYALYPTQLFSTPVHAQANIPITTPRKPVKPRFVVVSGKPVRITIPDYAIDLAVDEGLYNSADGSWSLSDIRAQFASFTAPANNHSGNTFIYGHATDIVFGRLAAATPPVGTIAKIYTNNNHTFTYQFTDARTLAPNDTSIFDDVAKAPATLTIQTCTGVFSEWRTMYHFSFVKVDK
jgi:LPXTG-site transpeptidase (sortase) family protein